MRHLAGGWVPGLLMPGVWLAAGGCVKAGSAPARFGGSDVITFEEVRETSANDAYQVVQLLRPRWLRPRAAPSLTNVRGGYARIYVDNVPLDGGTRELRTVPVGDIREIRYISPADATTRFGTGHAGGAIMVLTRTGEPAGAVHPRAGQVARSRGRSGVVKLQLRGLFEADWLHTHTHAYTNESNIVSEPGLGPSWGSARLVP